MNTATGSFMGKNRQIGIAAFIVSHGEYGQITDINEQLF